MTIDNRRVDMSILGSDGVDMIEKRLVQEFHDFPEQNTFTIARNSLAELIRYYRTLTRVCDHEWDVTSPVDTLEEKLDEFMKFLQFSRFCACYPNRSGKRDENGVVICDRCGRPWEEK